MDGEEREEPIDEPEEDVSAPERHRPDAIEPESAPVRRKRSVKRRRSTAWIALVLLLASIYVFWVLPYQLGSHPVQVEFSKDGK